MNHTYTDKEKTFLQNHVPGHTYEEIQKAFTKKFKWNITVGQIKGYMGNHKLTSGTKGQFKKGHVPENKGKKGYCAKGCEKTWFRKGNIPTNHRSVGSERINVYGYVEVKVEEPGKWELKHRVLWENNFGKIKKGKVIIFLKIKIRLKFLL